MAFHPPINVHESSRGNVGRGALHAHLRARRSKVTAALLFDSMCVIMGSGSTCQTLRNMDELLSEAFSSNYAYRYCVRVVGRPVPTYPVPVVRGDYAVLRRLLENMFERIWDGGDDRWERHVGKLLYHLYEACGQYGLAREVVSKLKELEDL